MITDQPKKSRKLALLIAALGGAALLILLGWLVLHFYAKPTPPVARELVAMSTPPSDTKLGLPVRLIIPKLNVNSAVENMGLTVAGEMDVPSNVVDVGWYKYGSKPGDLGSAVIDGHYDGPKGEAGVFANLSKLKKGDSLSVVNDRGVTISFVVRESKTYNQKDHPSEVFNINNGYHLNLITCSGAWDAKQNRFSKRLVVFADKTN